MRLIIPGEVSEAKIGQVFTTFSKSGFQLHHSYNHDLMKRAHEKTMIFTRRNFIHSSISIGSMTMKRCSPSRCYV